MKRKKKGIILRNLWNKFYRKREILWIDD